LSKIFDIYSRVYSRFLDEIGEYVQMVETADDIGTQSSLLISPDHYRKFIKPLEKKLYALIHEKAPHAAVFRHTDGSVISLIPEFIEIGIDVLNPIQTSAQGMEGERLKSKFGDQLTFHGTIEILNESREEIERDVRAKMQIFKKNGGYIFAPCNHIIDAAPETIIHLFSTAHRYGMY
jgi:uroporphyrinogen decarboxylase